MRLLITRRAREDLIEIRTFIADDNPAAARRLTEALKRRWRMLATFPLSGASREDVGEGMRHVVLGSYVTLYSIKGDTVEIARVLHASRHIGPTII